MIKNVYCLRVKCPLFLPDFNETWPFSTDYRKKYSNIKFHENPSSRRRVVPCGHTEGQTDKMKIAVSFAEAPKYSKVISN